MAAKLNRIEGERKIFLELEILDKDLKTCVKADALFIKVNMHG
jgi:hypothetical protein